MRTEAFPIQITSQTVEDPLKDPHPPPLTLPPLMARIAVVEDQFADDADRRWLLRYVSQAIMNGPLAMLMRHFRWIDTGAVEGVVPYLLHISCSPGDQLVIPECRPNLLS